VFIRCNGYLNVTPECNADRIGFGEGQRRALTGAAVTDCQLLTQFEQLVALPTCPSFKGIDYPTLTVTGL
jgi:hypothetical protein